MAQITNDRAADRPRLRLIAGGQAAAVHREEQKRRAELQQFIKACEALYAYSAKTEHSLRMSGALFR